MNIYHRSNTSLAIFIDLLTYLLSSFSLICIVLLTSCLTKLRPMMRHRFILLLSLLLLMLLIDISWFTVRLIMICHIMYHFGSLTVLGLGSFCAFFRMDYI